MYLRSKGWELQTCGEIEHSDILNAFEARKVQPISRCDTSELNIAIKSFLSQKKIRIWYLIEAANSSFL